jgi:hypothetical protein
LPKGRLRHREVKKVLNKLLDFGVAEVELAEAFCTPNH